MKKRILFLSPLPPPHCGSAISSEMCLNILKHSKLFEVKNIKLNYSKEMSDIGKINFNKIKGIFHVLSEISSTIKSFKPHLIYFVPATSGSGLMRDYLFFKSLERKFTGKILYHIRSRINPDNLLSKMFLKNMLANEKVIILGKELIEDVKWIVPKNRTFILPNAIENEISAKKFNQIVKQRQKNASFNLLFLSNMDETKGWFKLLEACKILKQNNIQFHCSFVGEWKDKAGENKFHQYIKEHNLHKNVSYLGKKTGKEKNKELEKADILIFPTEYHLETFGRVIVEAMMFGLPVIANGIATIPSIIQHNKTGFILKKNTPKEIVDFIIKLRNPELRSKMGIAGRKRFLENFELKDYEKKFLQTINHSI